MIPSEYKSLRERLGLTQAEFAVAAGVARETVAKRETTSRITLEAELAIRFLVAEQAGLVTRRDTDPPAERIEPYLAGGV